MTEREDTVEQLVSIINLKPIGYASTWFRVKNATPRQPTVSALTRGSITISKEIFSNAAHSLENLSQFSHAWIIFLFHKNGAASTKAKIAPPRLNGAKVGVFSTRSPHRPNPVGLTLAKIESVEGDTLHLCGLDLLDKTPIIDIKPYIPSYDSPQEDSVSNSTESVTPCVTNPAWTTLGVHQTLNVSFTEDALKQISQFSPSATSVDYQLKYLKTPEEAIQAVKDILREDPRSIYRKTKCQDRLYFCIVDTMHITSWFDEVINKCEVIRVMPYSIRKAMNETGNQQVSQDKQQ